MLQPHVEGGEEEFRGRETLVGEGEGLFSFWWWRGCCCNHSGGINPTRPSHIPPLQHLVVGQDVLGHYIRRGHAAVGAGAAPGAVEVVGEIGGDEAGVFFDLGDDVGLVDEREMAQGDERGEVVRDVLAAYVEAADGAGDGRAAQERRDGCVRVGGVD